MKLIKNIRVMWRITFSVILSLVIVFNISSNVFHDHSHSDDEVICNESTEADACHQYLFHHKKSQECDGSHQHFSSEHEDCFACQYYQENSTLKPEHTSAPSNYYIKQYSSFVSLHHNYSFDILLCYSLRGPPEIA